jgi:AcrR family transcriptional regulator
MPSVKAARQYRSPRRAQTARTTRRLVLDAARALFLQQGYVGTTIDQIAARAGVSKPTVFAAVGSKRTLLKELRDLALAGDEEPIEVPARPWVQAVLEEPDPWRTLHRYAHGHTQLAARYAQLEEVLHAAAGADDELRDLWQTNEQERLQAARLFIDNLLGKSPLKPGLDREAAVDVLWTHMATDNFRRLVRDRGWSMDQYERWLAETLCAQLLAPPQ